MTRELTLVAAFVALGCGPGEEGPTFIRGSARLPECNEPPALDLDDSLWFDQGTVTVTSSGCEEPPGATLDACGLRWEFTQEGADVAILVDREYRVLGRICASRLYLEGGWWLTVEDPAGVCDYDDGVEARIESGGSVLEIADNREQMTGKLAIAERCTAEYDVTFVRSGGAPTEGD